MLTQKTQSVSKTQAADPGGVEQSPQVYQSVHV